MARPPATKWGDREQRRRDILTAARAEVARRGFLGFSMREVASGAGVSPGTLYAYFATKDDLFCALFAERLEQLHDEVSAIAADADDLERLLVDIAGAYRPVYVEYGHQFDLWTSARAGELAEPASRILATLDAALDRLGAFDGLSTGDRDRVMPFLWISLVGLCDHFTARRHLLHPYSFDELARFTARRLVVALGKDQGGGSGCSRL